jgi:hypothetical protein
MPERDAQQMKLSHLALTVIEDPDHAGRFHWLLLESNGEIDQVRESAASEDTFDSAQKAFDAGASRWRLAMRAEDEDADPVGNPAADAE